MNISHPYDTYSAIQYPVSSIFIIIVLHYNNSVALTIIIVSVQRSASLYYALVEPMMQYRNFQPQGMGNQLRLISHIYNIILMK